MGNRIRAHTDIPPIAATRRSADAASVPRSLSAPTREPPADFDFTRIPALGAKAAEAAGIPVVPLVGRPGVAGEAEGETIRLARGRGGRDDGRLVGHEIAHVLQHRRALAGGVPLASDTQAEHEARAAGERAARGEHATVRLAAAPGRSRQSRLSDLVRTLPTKAAVFDELRRASAADRADPLVASEAATRFAGQPDDLWLATQLITHGAEPLWPSSAIDDRTRRASAGRWAAEGGNIEAGIADPDPDTAAGAPRIRPIPAYFFPGRDASQRVLVIGGVHGSEPEGIEVVERLRARLASESAAGNPPDYATILVPTLVARTAAPGTRASGHYDPGTRDPDRRWVPAGVTGGSGGIEPNRNLPFPGTAYAAARARGAGGGAELETLPSDPTTGVPLYGSARRAPRGSRSSLRMLPETRALLALLERFDPTRIVSVHSHSPSRRIGDAPGVFVDPRGIDPSTGRNTNPAAGAEDIALTQRLLADASGRVSGATRTSGFSGNAAPRGASAPNVVYASGRHAEGNSLGMYGPVATSARPAATTITVEVAQGIGVGPELDALVDAHRDAIDAVILRRPPATGGP